MAVCTFSPIGVLDVLLCIPLTHREKPPTSARILWLYLQVFHDLFITYEIAIIGEGIAATSRWDSCSGTNWSGWRPEEFTRIIGKLHTDTGVFLPESFSLLFHGRDI